MIAPDIRISSASASYGGEVSRSVLGSDEPGPSYSITIRVAAPRSTSILTDITRIVDSTGAVVNAVDLVGVEPSTATVDVSFHARDDAHVLLVESVLVAAEYSVRHISDRTFLSHLGGTISVVPKTPIRTRDDLSLIYTPGVARIASAIAERPEDAWNLSMKGNSVAILTDGSAVLGLGRLGPLGALPVMEGKAALFKTFADVDAFPICLNVSSVDELVATAAAVAPGFGGINLEDIAAPACFEVEARLQALLDIPVFHDDQHGTAIVVLAGLMNAVRITERNLEDLRVVVVGIGAAGHAISTALLDSGIRDLVCVDVNGPITELDKVAPHHTELARQTNRAGYKSLSEAMKGADAFIGVARRGSIETALFHTMAKRPIIFALSNPHPEALPNEVPRDAILATGRSDFPNQVNNALCFPGLFRGCLDARATAVTPAMRRAAAIALAASVSDEQREIGVVIPSLFNLEVHRNLAIAVRDAVKSSHQTVN